MMALTAGAVALIMGLSACERNEALLVDDDGVAVSVGDGAGQPVSFGLDDRVRLGDWEFVVHGVTDPFDNGSAFGAPRAGHRWVAVDVEVFNVGTEPRDVLPLVCFDIQDGLNQTYDQEFFAETSVGRPQGEVAPAGSRRGTVVWELPVEATELRMNVKCDLFSAGSATFQLT
ncbi:MAG: DUF4352 domain-containing protein [Actinomycetota bacterium]